DAEADEERERRDDLEVEERLAAHAPDGLEVAGLRDTGDDRRDQDRDDDRLDERDERLREELEERVGRGVLVLGQKPAEDDAEDEADEDVEGARAPDRPPR